MKDERNKTGIWEERNSMKQGYFYKEAGMSHIELTVKPILEEMGLFKGKDVSVKDAFVKYLNCYPKGIGPLGVFMRAVEDKLNLNVKEIRNGGKRDFMFVYSQRDDVLYFDPRAHQV